MTDHFPHSLQRERIATQCICCGGLNLQKSPAILMPFVSHRALGLPPANIDASWGLRMIPQGIAYCLCNTLQCMQCGVLFMDIRFSDREMQRYYQGYLGKEYEDLREHYEPGFRSRNESLKAQHQFLHLAREFILKHTNPKHILDWGGGNGINTPIIGGGRQVDVYDIGEGPTTPGTSRISKAQAFSSHYELIVCRHVLEHIPYPLDVLKEINQCMKKETFLYIEVPHEAIMVDKSNINPSDKRHWHEHINFFSIPSLEHLLRFCGLTSLSIQSSPIGGDGKTSSCSNIIQVIAKKDNHTAS